MADAVQYIMEKMVPELEELQDLNLFNKDEIRQIVQKRREFEYNMKRTPLRKVDCLRYVEYELNLDALRRQRKKRMGIKKNSVSDVTTGIRVHHIFERTIMKLRGDVDLWLQHIAFCKNQGSTKMLSKLFTSALQVHPQKEIIWIEAASWEFSSNLNVDNARILMQRSIRINPHSKKLWHEYFRLEFLYIQKLRVRREVLGLDDKVKTKKEITLDIAPVEGEEIEAPTGTVVEETSEVERTRQDILTGAIPKIVYRNAIEAIPNDLAFRLEFLSISNIFPESYSKTVADVILESLKADFSEDAAVWSAYSEQAMHDSKRELDDRRSKTIERYQSAMSNHSNTSISEAFIKWCIAEISRGSTSDWFAQQVEQAMNKLGPLTPKLYFAWIDYTLRVCGLEAATIKALNGTCAFPEDGKLWLLRAQLAMRLASIKAQDPSPPTKRAKKTKEASVFDAAVAVIEEGIKKAKEDIGSLWQRYLQLQMNNNGSVSVIRTAFQNALKAASPWTAPWSSLRLQYLNWTLQSQGIAATRVVYKSFLGGQMLCNPYTLALLRWCVQVETSQTETAAQRSIVMGLYEKIIDLFGNENEDVWIEYMRYYREQGLHKDANNIHWRATRIFPSSVTLLTMHQLNE